jgi:starch synthase
MKILMVAAEAAPYAKTGGLADSVAALARELARGGDDVRLILPFHRSIGEEHRRNAIPLPHPLSIHLGREHWARVHELIEPTGLRVYFLEHHHYFGRDRLYDDGRNAYSDNGERFAFLCRAAIDLPAAINWTPDVYHCHDWMAGLVPVYLETNERWGRLRGTTSVLTVHNLAHQGYADRFILGFAGLPQSLFRPDQLEACGGVNFLKGGLYFTNKLTTVSPSYAAEIQTAEFGFGLQGVLRFRSGDLVGILNGIDRTVWDPATDPHIPHPYGAGRLRGKVRCKEVFCSAHSFDGHAPLCGVIARLCPQKGLDVLADALPHILDSMAMNFAILGAGEWDLENRFQSLAARYPNRLTVHIGHSEPLAHRIEAASDFFLMPSRFEPCGLNQLYSLRYGTLPIARATGGLRDTIDPYDESSGSGTGFLFNDLTPNALHGAVGWACSTYYDRPRHMAAMVRRAMLQDFSWKVSAARYRECYQWAAESKGCQKSSPLASTATVPGKIFPTRPARARPAPHS